MPFDLGECLGLCCATRTPGGNVTEVLSSAPPESAGGASVDDQRQLYRLMKLITLVDGKIGDEARAGRLKAATYPVRGLEGVCAAMGVAVRRDDHLVSTYRNVGDTLAKGSDLERIIAEIYEIGRAHV